MYDIRKPTNTFRRRVLDEYVWCDHVDRLYRYQGQYGRHEPTRGCFRVYHHHARRTPYMINSHHQPASAPILFLARFNPLFPLTSFSRTENTQIIHDAIHGSRRLREQRDDGIINFFFPSFPFARTTRRHQQRLSVRPESV